MRPAHPKAPAGLLRVQLERRGMLVTAKRASEQGVNQVSVRVGRRVRPAVVAPVTRPYVGVFATVFRLRRGLPNGSLIPFLSQFP